MADVEDLGPLAQQPRERERVRALALQPQRERGQRAVQHPGLERPGDRAALRAVRAQRRRPLGVAHRDGAEERSEWPESALVALSMRRRRRGRAAAGRAAWRACCRPRAGRRPRGRRPRPRRCRRRRARGWTASRSRRASRPSQAATIASVSVGTKPHLDAARREPVAGDAAHPRVAVVGDDEHVARPERGLEHRADAPPCPSGKSTVSPPSSSPSARSTAVQVGLPSRP